MTIEVQPDAAPITQEFDASQIMLEGIAQLSLLRQENSLSEEDRKIVEEASYDLITASLRMMANGDDKLTDESRRAHMHVCWQEMAASELIAKANSPKVRRLIYTFMSTAHEVYKTDIRQRIELLEGDMWRSFAEVAGVMRLGQSGAANLTPVEQVDYLYHFEDTEDERRKNIARIWACGLISPIDEKARKDEGIMAERTMLAISLHGYFQNQKDEKGLSMMTKAMISNLTGEPLKLR